MKRFTLALGLVLSTCLQVQAASTEGVPTQVADTSISSGTASTQLSRTAEQNASIWGLEPDDWKRYETIMEGPRGYWSPGLDPLTVLGIEARTDAERMRYARLQVVAEFNRVEAELAYQRAYDQAFKEQFPDTMLIGDTQSSEPSFLKNQLPPGGLKDVPVTLFVSLNCAKCDAAVTKATANQQRVDVYVIGAPNDAAIRTWAAKVGIQPQQVQRRQVTLNHNKEELKLVTGQDTITLQQLPLAFKRVGQVWQKVDI